MELKLELHIPDSFFDSAKETNNFESLSERLSKSVLNDILHIEGILRGDDKNFEPDYLTNKTGYEVTLGINDSLIPILRGRKTFNDVPHNLEKELIDAIKKALDKKSKKDYSLATTIIIFTLTPLLEWYSSFYLSECLTYRWWKTLQKNRDRLFAEIFENYIKKEQIFEDVLILQPTHDGYYILYSIKNFADGQNFMTKIAITDDGMPMFPRYRMLDCKQGNFPIVYQISEVLYK